MSTLIDNAVSKISTILGLYTRQGSATLESILDQREAIRIQQQRQYWAMYNGRHYDYVRDDGEMPYVNYCYGAVEKSVAWLVGDAPQLKAREDIHTIIDEIYQEVLENSMGDRFWYESAQMGSVTGDCLLHVAYDPSVNYGKGGVAIRTMDSERTFIEYRNVGQKRKLTRVMVIWDELTREGVVKTRAEVWSDTEIKVYPPGIPIGIQGFIDDSKQPPEQVDQSGNAFITYPNPYGELPFVHIPNLPVSYTVHGRSDLHDLWILNREMDEQLLSYKDNADYHGNPLTLLYGISAKDVEKGANKVWGNLPKDARVENLTQDSTHPQIIEYLKMLEKYAGLSSVPMYLSGAESAIQSGDTSAAALRLAFLPLVELTNRKRMSYGLGYKQAFEMAVRFTNNIFGLGLEALDAPDPKLKDRLKESPMSKNKAAMNKLLALRTQPYYTTEVIFQEHLPKNRTLELADIQTEMQLNLESVSGALRRLGVADPTAKMQEIIDDAPFIQAMQQYTTPPQPDFGGGDTTGTAGGPPGEQNANQIEEQTGQSADRTMAQRAAQGKGGV